MITEEIEKIHDELNNEFLTLQPYNTEKVRYETIQRILKHLESNLTEEDDVSEIMVICDNLINTPEVIDNNQMVAKVKWTSTDRFDEEVYSIDLTFGP